MLGLVNHYKIRTTDNTLDLVRRRIMNKKKDTLDEKTRAIAKMTAFHNKDPAYFSMYIRLFGQKPPKTPQTLSVKNQNVYTQILGLNQTKGYTQNNVNLAYTRKSDKNLPMSQSPKTQRALNEAYAKLTKHLQNQSVFFK